CNTFTDCASCLANRGKRYNCSWCDDIQKCSDGYDRSRQQWIRAQCHRLAAADTCPNSMEDTYDNYHFSSSSLPSMVQFEKRKESSIATSRSYSTLHTFRTIVITLLLSVLILSLAALAVTYMYAYRNPTSPAGMWLLEHRPSTYIARFKRSTGSI
ncbi:unnamed protein product, partial [Rotaria magnacalcarata]